MWGGVGSNPGCEPPRTVGKGVHIEIGRRESRSISMDSSTVQRALGGGAVPIAKGVAKLFRGEKNKWTDIGARFTT